MWGEKSPDQQVDGNRAWRRTRCPSKKEREVWIFTNRIIKYTYTWLMTQNAVLIIPVNNQCLREKRELAVSARKPDQLINWILCLILCGNDSWHVIDERIFSVSNSWIQRKKWMSPASERGRGGCCEESLCEPGPCAYNNCSKRQCGRYQLTTATEAERKWLPNFKLRCTRPPCMSAADVRHYVSSTTHVWP